MIHTITLIRTSQGWMARFSDPEVKELFGTDTIPTAFTASADSDTVYADIRRRNPAALVMVEV